MTVRTRGELGAYGEQVAVDHLMGLGLTVLGRNWRCRYGELDVVAEHPPSRTVVFVEVKTRSTDRFGGVEQAVGPQKVARLRRLAGMWLAAQPRSFAAVRLDVVGVRVTGGAVPHIVHIRGVG